MINRNSIIIPVIPLPTSLTKEMDRWRKTYKDSLWKDTDENWKSTYRGLDKTGFNSLIKNAIIIAPKGEDFHNFGLFFVVYSTIIQWIFLYVGFVTLFKASNDLILFIEVAHYYLILLALHILFMEHYITKMKMNRQVFQEMDKDIFDYGTEFDRNEMENNRLKTVYYMSYFKVGVTMCFSVTGLVICLFPLVQLALGAEKMQGEIVIILPIPFWFPFNTETLLGFCLAYFLEVNIIAIAAFYMESYFPFLMQMMIEIISHFRVLNHSISRIGMRTSAMYNTFKPLNKEQPSTSEIMDVEDSLYEYCYTQCLRKNIFHHKAIIEFVDLFQNLHSTLFGVLLGANMLVIAATTIVITKVAFSMDTLKFYLLMLIELINVFSYCFLGTLITEEAKKIGISFYSTPWSNSSKKNKKIIQFILMRVSHDIILKGNGVFSLSLQLYIQIMQTSYSIFNLFNSADT